MPCHLSTYGTQNKECTSPEMALWRESNLGAVFQTLFKNISAIFVNMHSDLTSVAVSVNIQSSFTVYTAALHALMLNSLLLAYFWLGLSWIDSIDSISANKRFSSSQTSSRKPYSNSKQQEKQKHSAETTINFSFFGPKMANFHGILGFSMSQNPTPWAQNGLKPLV